MNAFELLADNLKFSLGWTLLHTLWQGVLILILTRIALLAIDKNKSSARYFIVCTALFVLTISCIATFFYMSIQTIALGQATTYTNEPVQLFLSNSPITLDANFDLWSTFVMQINSHMPLLVSAWLMGVIFFSIRFFGGLIYIQHLKNKIIRVNDEWADRVNSLAERIGLSRMVTLAESIHINKPMVLGYVKPMVLVPIGLLTSLPTSQIEAILLHELYHIKRHDFLINLIQSIIEVLLFFNPFVWILSRMIREEREHCCDDQVIGLGSSPLEYAKALSHLEEVSLTHTPRLALAFNKDKYQVFKRIKRIMEKSVNQNQSKIRPFALVLLVAVGLLCASWLTNQSGKSTNDNPSDVGNGVAVMADTTIKKKNEKIKGADKKKEEKSATYSRKTITTYDKDGKPHDEVVEEFNGDEELRPMLSNPGSFSFSIPSIPSIPAIPSIPSIPSIPFHNGFTYSFDGDSISGDHFLSEEEQEKWEEFGREMEKRFEHFGAGNEEFGHMMEAWGENFGNDFSFHFDDAFGNQMEDLHDRLEDLNFDKDFSFKFDESMKDMGSRFDEMEEKLKEHKSEWKEVESNIEAFESALQDQLIKDSYLKKGEKVESMNWGDGKLTINGIAIKDKDVSKYEALTDKYFKGKRGYYKRN